jgi:hypothetical protein
VKIIYKNGTAVDAILLSRQGDTLRAAIRGDEDVREFTRLSDGWVTEEFEPVVLEFEWQRNPAAEVPAEEDCICPKELAAKLLAKLRGGAEQPGAAVVKVYVFLADGTRKRICLDQLNIN